MSLQSLFLLFLACGAAVFPLILMALRFAASLKPAARWSQKISSVYETALSLSLVAWIAAAMLFYVIVLQIERQKPCIEQATNQLTLDCKKELRVIPK